jgi:O-Antigen ligase
MAGALVLAGPTALAFFSGAYFAGPRAWAGALAWGCVIAAIAVGAQLPRGRWPRVALGGLAAMAVWSLASIAWAPVAGDAYQAAQIVVLYAGALLAAALVLRDSAARRLAEPVLALGAAVVVGYGLAGRLLPGVLHYARSVSAQGRLEQPLTYWNAMGELAALGLVLCARLAGDPSRPWAVRTLAAAAAAPLGLGLYASFSRGALFAALAGVIALLALAPRRDQLAALAVVIAAAVVAAAAVSPLHGVTSLSGPLAHREHQGLIALAVVVVAGALAAGAQLAVGARVRSGPLPASPLVAHRGAIATVLVLAGLGVAIVVGAHESSGANQGLSGGASRLVSLRSNRFDYWHVALRAFVLEPLHGVGAGNWQVYWLRWRTIAEFAADAHSLPLQTLAELGIVGVLALAAFLGGLLGAAGRALRRPSAPVGAVAGLITYLAHAPLDWDWEMPAVTLVAIVLAGLVMSVADDADDADDADVAPAP